MREKFCPNTGFRKNYSTADHIFSIYNIADTYLKKKKKLYAFFVDFRAAFDSIVREALFYKLFELGLSSRIINILRALYNMNTACVWDGVALSEEFPTTMGLKQGCILSALLFVLFINDITDTVRGGIQVGGTTIPALMYADDIVFFAETVVGMQLMMNRLGDYCKHWNLVVNLQKSKMMVFRGGGGRLSKNEKWTFNGCAVETVREYKYLGVLITSNLNMKRHLDGKLSEAKRAVSAVWERCIKNNYIEHSAKQKLFRSTAASILLYGAQVWGYLSFEAVEKFLRYFLKRIFRLSKNTPNYMLYLETGTPPMIMDTLSVHFNYVVKVMEMKNERIPKIILNNMIRTRGSMMEEWESLATECGINLLIGQDENSSSLRFKFNDILEKLGKVLYDRNVVEARSSVFRCFYSRLEYNLGSNTYLLNGNSINKISIVFKTRGELLNLNYVPHRSDLPILCSLCNMKTREDTCHFIAICPVLKEFRVRYFEKSCLNDDELIGILNGERGWDVLNNYVVAALRYRNSIIEENF